MSYFTFGSQIVAKADALLNNQTARSLWHSFSANSSSISFEEGMKNRNKLFFAKRLQTGISDVILPRKYII